MTAIDTPPDLDLVLIALDDLHPADDNPRHDLGDLTELAASIASIGVLQPLVVVERHVGGGFTIVAGHRRHAAARIAELEQVPCVVRAMNLEERQTAMLVENLHRRDLDPLDEATGFQHLADLGHSQREIAELVGCNQSHVSRRLALTKLPEKAVELVRAGTIQLRAAEQLAALADGDVDEVVTKVLERAGDREVHDYDVEYSIKKLADERKRADAIAGAEASKKKRLKKDPRYDYAWQVCKKADATHWYIDDYGGTTVHWVRKKPKDDTTTQPSAYELERQKREAAEQQRVGQLLALLERDESIVLELGLGYLVDKVCGNGWQARVALDGTELHAALADSVIADLTDDRPLFVAVATLIGIADRAIEGFRFDGDDEIAALWARVAELADASGIADGDGEVSLDETPDNELPGMWERADFEGGQCDVNEQFALVDAAPAEADDDVPADLPEIVKFGDFPSYVRGERDGAVAWTRGPEGEPWFLHLREVDDPESPAAEVVQEPEATQADGPGDADDFSLLDEPAELTISDGPPPKRPWGTYDGNDVARICTIVASINAADKIHAVIAYEQATGGRAGIIAACRDRLTELGA